MSQLVVIGVLEVHPDDAPAMARLTATMAAATRQEPGCLQYAFGHDVEQPGCFRLSEQWRDAAALDEHFATPHMAAFRRGLGGLRLVRRAVTAYTVAGEKAL
ncbi:MAG TPA: putative quinol monooxygenase [Kofleriaceae bacterium]|nr:putative quinol monooxygenase [Kofleriaceae bacterium]